MTMRSRNPARPFQRATGALHYENVAVLNHSGVQSVSVKAETGLEFVNGPLDKSGFGISKGQRVIVDITYAGCRTLTQAASEIGSSSTDLIIHHLGDQSDLPPHNFAVDYQMKIEKCFLIGMSSSVRAPGRATYTNTYWGLWHNPDGGTLPHLAGSVGNGSTGHFSCCTAHANAVAYESSIKVNYQYIHKKGSNAPYALVLQYPVVSTESITYMDGDIDNIKKPISCNPSVGTLESITVGGAQAGNDSSIQTYTYNYRFQDDYGLSRKIVIPY